VELDCLETIIGIGKKQETAVVHRTGGTLAVACPLGRWDWSEGDVGSKIGDGSGGGMLWA
jgi:hypothetical protein